jgi:tetratricopeptide (TPR) repeat protein
MKRLILIGCVLAGLGTRGMASDFPMPTNIAHLRAQHGLDEAACATLRERGFVVLGDRSVRGLHEAYPKDPRDHHVFVTTDALLQLWHDLYLETLKAAELRGMAPNLSRAVGSLARGALAELQRARDARSRLALRDAALILCVADRLLGGSAKPPPDLRAQVDALVAKVMAHRDREAYPGDDFTQYTVRGHYAASEELARYFRGSMWLSRRILSVRPERRLPDPDSPLGCAVALAHVLRHQANARTRLANVNAARQAIAATPNAIAVEQCLTGLDRTLGKGWTLESALIPRNLDLLRIELDKPAYPSAQVRTGSAWPGQFPDRVIALVPDHAVPDSVLFRSTTFDAMPDRSLPSGLDVAAALGHRVAAEELRRAEPQAREVLKAAERLRPIMRDDGRTVYRGWLGALRTLSVTDHRAPDFMRSVDWEYQKANTCLAGWSQLRHASILYAAHSNATMGLSDETPRGWIEPYPAFYRAMADLAERTARIFRRVGGMDAEREALLTAYASKCREFATCAEAELEGKLTRQQGEVIRSFGAWLTRFPFRSQPIIADVATGSGGQVLHAAVGDMNPIIVMPDRSSAMGYVGWVSSYYEIVRPTTERLTDAAWQAMLDSPAMIPDRPAWTAHFLHVDRGPRWEARAPLRQAERLFFAGKADEAIALLRSAIERDPHSVTATEFRYRIGEHYRQKRQFDQAEAEWTACLQMHGGDAWDRALQGLQEIRQERRIDRNWLDDARKGVDRLKEILLALRQPLRPMERTRLEREAATLVLTDHRKSWWAQDAPTVSDVLRVCRDPAVREALEWLRLIAGGDDFGSRLDRVGVSDYLERAARFVKTARSPALRASVYIKAIELGYMEDRPIEAARVLAWCGAPKLADEDMSEAFALVREARMGPELRVLDRHHRATDAALAAEHLAEKLWHAGRVHEAVRVAAIAPKTGGSGDSDQRRSMYARYSDYGHAPLAMFAKASRNTDTQAAEEFVGVYRRFPDSRIAPLALGRAEALYSHLPETRARSAEIRNLVLSRYPNSAIAALYRADAALADDRLDEAERLYGELERRAGEPTEETSFVQDRVGGNRKYRLDAVRKLRQILEPVLRPAGREGLLKPSVLLEVGHRGYQTLPQRAPDLAADIRLAFLRHADYSYVAADFLKHHPDHAAAEEAWGGLRKSFLSLDPHDLAGSVAWLVDLVNREPAYRCRNEAETVLERAIAYAHAQPVSNTGRAVREWWPGTRAGLLAGVIEARSLILENRPEEALAVLKEIATEPAMDAALKERADALRRCAEQTVAAKRNGAWTPIRTYKETPPEYVALPLEDEAKLPMDDLSVLLRSGIYGQARTTIYRGVLYVAREDDLIQALDTATGARIGIAVCPYEYNLRIIADDEGVRVTDHGGNTVVYGLRPREGR